MYVRPGRGARTKTEAAQRARAVWAAVTRSPQAPIGELARASGLSYTNTAKYLRQLRDLGYIAFDSGQQRARTILVPFSITRRRRNGAAR